MCGLAACQTAAKEAFAQDAAAKEDAVTIQLVCESEDVYQIYYTAYLAGKESGMGGWADVDGGVLTPESDLSAVLTKDLLGEGDVSTLSMDFSPTGKGTPWSLPPQSRWTSPRNTGKAIPLSFPGMRKAGSPRSCVNNLDKNRGADENRTSVLYVSNGCPGFLAVEIKGCRQRRHQKFREGEGQPDSRHLSQPGQQKR